MHSIWNWEIKMITTRLYLKPGPLYSGFLKEQFHIKRIAFHYCDKK